MSVLRDKATAVTGAGSGIGRATALSLPKAGARVAVTDLNFDWARSVADTPLGRLETPQDVVGVVAFLASDTADFITGESMQVNARAWMG